MEIKHCICCIRLFWGWPGGAMVLGKLPVPGRPTIWMIVRQGPIALAVGAGGGCLDIFILLYPFSPLSPSLWETARYRLKHCLKRPLSPKQPTNQLYLWARRAHVIYRILKGPLKPKTTNQPIIRFLTLSLPKKQTTKISSEILKKMLSSSYIILRIQRLEGK